MFKICQNILDGFANLSVKQQRLSAFALGSLSVLALAPFYILPILFITISSFLLLHDQCRSLRHGFWLGWWYGFGFFLCGLYWISYALFVDIAGFWWVIPFAVTGLPVLLSTFWGVASLILTWVNSKSALQKWLYFVVVFSSFEWLRGHLFTGFPWNLFGYVWVGIPHILQLGSVVGVYGLTVYSFLLFSVGYVVMREHKHKIRYLVVISAALLSFLTLFIYGQNRIEKYQDIATPPTYIRLIQPHILQKEKWDPEKIDEHFEKLIMLSQQESAYDLSAIIWPETATSFFDTLSVRRFNLSILRILKPNTYLITGVLDYQRDHQNMTTAHNRLSVFDHEGERVHFYDKHHLVPFGEYLPFEEYWPINPIASNGVMFQAGKGLETVNIKPSLPPFSPLICYEVIFPGAVINKDSNPRPKWLINLTNDAWYGYTTGPFQHLAITQMRAVEEGLPLIRVANTGVSAVIDATGIIKKSLPLNTHGVIDSSIPRAFGKTTYSQWGDWIFLLCLVSLTVLALLINKKIDKK